MRLQGKAFKDGKFWVIEVPSVDIYTQCFKKNEVLFYICDAMNLLQPGLGCEAEWASADSFTVAAKNSGLYRSFILKRARIKAGLTQDELATRLGQRTHSTISAYESGAKHPSVESLLKYLKKMDFDVELTLNRN